jgi:RNA polymerase sigma-70 factor, ECF subfamily
MAGSSGGESRTAEAERKAFDSIYRRHGDEIYRFCLRRLRNTALAEEAMATVFLEAWRRRGEVDLVTRPARPWLYGVARNVLRNQYRRQRHSEATVRNLESLQRNHAEDPAEELARRHATLALLGSLQALPEGQRAVVTLCLLGGRSYEAAAGHLQVPVGTVRSRLNRARLNLVAAVRTSAGF